MTAKYHINLFWSEPDGAWVADVPDLQSCSAFGDSPAQALAEVEKAWRLGSRSHARTGCRSRNPLSRGKTRRLGLSTAIAPAPRETPAFEPFRPPASALGMALS